MAVKHWKKALITALGEALIITSSLTGTTFAEPVIKSTLITENIPEPTNNLLEQIKRYHNIRQYQFQGWMFSGALVTTRIGRTTQAFLITDPKKHKRRKGWARGGYIIRSADGMNAQSEPRHETWPEPQQVTFFTGPAREILPSPDGRHFIASQDVGGNEQYQGRFFSVGQSGSLPFTDAQYRNTGFIFSHDGKWIAWQRSAGDNPNWDILIAPTDNPARARQVVYQGRGTWLAHDFSPDNRFLLLSNYISVTESTLFLLSVDTGKVKSLNPRRGAVAYGIGKFTRDGKAVIVQSDEGREFVGLLRIDLASGKRAALNPAQNGDVTDFALSLDGRFLAYTVNVGGRSRLFLARAATGRIISTPHLPMGVIAGLAFDQSGKRLGFTFDGARHPAGAWVYHRRSGRLSRWTSNLTQNYTPRRFRTVELIHYPSFVETNGHRRQIPAYIYKPQKTAKRPVPVIISIHGGPEAQYRPGFSPRFQYWLHELGAAVIAPNVRGSTGYGGNYVALDNGRLRPDALKDIGALLAWIRTQKDLDATRIIVHGGSYGGYMVLAAMARYPGQIAGGVDIVGISDFVTFLENTKSYRQALRREEYGDERDPQIRAFLKAISPLNHADKIAAPLLIVQGKNDPRVPYMQSKKMRDAVKTNQIPVWFMMAEDEGHGFQKQQNVLALHAAEHTFMGKIFSRQTPP